MSDQIADYFVHPNAIVASTQIGPRTRVWAFANVQKEVVIGADCNICDHCFVENHVVIGDRVTIKNGVSLWDGMIVQDDVFIGPNAVFTNDVYPRSKVYLHDPVKTVLEQGCSIGANSVIVAGHSIGRYAMIGAGAVVTKSVPAYTLWFGNPAKFVAFICKCAKRLSFKGNEATCECGLAYELRDGLVVPL